MYKCIGEGLPGKLGAPSADGQRTPAGDAATGSLEAHGNPIANIKRIHIMWQVEELHQEAQAGQL